MVALVGRSRERTKLNEFVTNTASGAGGTVALIGSAGMGKTRLLDELNAQATAGGVLTARAGCSELEPGVPGAAARRLAQVLNAAGAGCAELGEPEDLADAVQRLVTQGRPLICMLDDAQWLDAASLAFVLALAHVGDESAFGLALATRPPGPASTTLTRLLAAVERRGAAVLQVEPLPDGDVEALVRQVTEDAIAADQSALLHAAGGNPFLVLELADAWRAGARPAPENVLAHTLSQLAPRTRTLLNHASVFGREAALVDLAHMEGSTAAELADSVNEATASGLVSGENRGLRFRHDLIREAVYALLPTAVRGALHLQAARALETRGVAPAELAVHLVEGALPGDGAAVEWLRRASAEVAAADLEAATLLLEAARRLCLPHASEIAAIDERLAILYAWTGRSEEAISRVSSLLAGATSVREEARLRAVLAEALARGGDEPAAGREAELLLHQRDLPANVRASLHLLVATGVWQTDPARCRDLVDEARRLGGGDHRVEIAAIELEATSYSAETASAEYLDRAATGVALARRSAAQGLPLAGAHLTWACANAGEAAWAAERDGDARHALAEAEQHARRSGLVATWVPGLMGMRAEVHMISCRWDDALADIEAREEMLADHGRRDTSTSGIPMRTAALRARIGILTGRSQSSAHLEQWQHLAEDAVEHARCMAWRMHDAHLRGHDNTALELGIGFVERLRTLDRLASRAIGWHVPWLEGYGVLTAGGRPTEAAVVADAMLPVCERNRWLPRWHAAAMVVDGWRRRDRALIMEAAELAAQVESPLLRFQTLCGAILAAVGLGATAEARSMAATASELAVVHELALPPPLARTLGARTPRRPSRPTTGWASLTPSEGRVAELVAGGLSNRAIAEELLVSKYTVESHLKHIFQKLHITSRVQLATLVMAEGRGAG